MFLKNKLLLGIFSLPLFFASCGQFSNKPSANQDKDSTRIVCVSKQLTELLFDLGQGNKIVGVDLSSTFPEAAKKIPTVGYHMMLSAEGIAALRPTIVIFNKGTDAEVGPITLLPQLQKIGIHIKQYPAAGSIDSLKMLIHLLGKDFNATAKADSICNKLDADMKIVAEKQKQYEGKPKPRVLIIHYGRKSNRYFVMGNNGTPTDLIEMAGGVNAADTTKWRNLSAETIVKDQPDVILATDYGFDKAGGVGKFLDVMPGLSLTPAGENKKVYRISEHDLLYLGPRTGENILKLMDIIHR
ncbi:MAG: ABC transporter substrate-binding protein [Bacteroidia bacterium]